MGSRRRSGFTRGRLNRGGFRSSRIQVTKSPETKEKITTESTLVEPSENVDVSTTTSKPSRSRDLRKRPSRLPSRFSFRGRGRKGSRTTAISTTSTSTTTETPILHIEEEIQVTDNEIKDIPLGEDVAMEKTEESPKEIKEVKKPSGRRNNRVFGRFRNRNSRTTTTPRPTTTTASSPRKSSFLGKRRRRPSNNRRQNKIPVEAEEEITEKTPLEEAIDISAVELEAEASEPEPTIIVDPADEVETEKLKKPARESSGKRRSLLSMMRRKNKRS